MFADQNPAPALANILMVEDNLDVAEITGTLLRELGYAVTHAANADAALDLLTPADKFDLVFTDIVMPGSLDGVALAEHIKKHHPALPVLLTSGYNRTNAAANHFVILRKPYPLSALETAISAALGGRAG